MTALPSPVEEPPLWSADRITSNLRHNLGHCRPQTFATARAPAVDFTGIHTLL